MVAGRLDPPARVADGGGARRAARRRRADADERDRRARVRRGRPTSLFEVRKQRSEAKQPLKVPITKVTGARPTQDGLDLHAARRGRPARRRCACRRSSSSAGEPREIVVQGYEPAPSCPMPLDPVALSRPRPPRARRGHRRGRRHDRRRSCPAAARARGMLLAKADCVLAGLDVASRRFGSSIRDVRDVRRDAGRRPLRAGRRDRATSTGSARALLDRRAHGAQLPAAPVRHRDAHAPVRRRRRRRDHRPRHAQDDADAARAREVRGPRRRRARTIASACSTRC